MTKRINISLRDPIIKASEAIIEARMLGGLSQLIDRLIFEEIKRMEDAGEIDPEEQKKPAPPAKPEKKNTKTK